MKYNSSHTNPMDWIEFHQIVNQLIEQLDNYQKKQKIKFDAVAPMLRSGGIPAIMIANKMQIIPIIPFQVKYNYDHGGVDTITPPICPKNLSASDTKDIVVTECNTYSGNSAQRAYELLSNSFPNANIHYTCVTKVYGGPEKIDGYKSYHVGKWTNEAFKDDAPDNCREGITIFPWETAEYELQDINNA